MKFFGKKQMKKVLKKGLLIVSFGFLFSQLNGVIELRGGGKTYDHKVYGCTLNALEEWLECSSTVFYLLVDECRKIRSSGRSFSSSPIKCNQKEKMLLWQNHLIDHNGVLHPDVSAIACSAAVGEGSNMQVVDPRAEGSSSRVAGRRRNYRSGW